MAGTTSFGTGMTVWGLVDEGGFVLGDGLFVGLGLVFLNEALDALVVPARGVSVAIVHSCALLRRLRSARSHLTSCFYAAITNSLFRGYARTQFTRILRPKADCL